MKTTTYVIIEQWKEGGELKTHRKSYDVSSQEDLLAAVADFDATNPRPSIAPVLRRDTTSTEW